MEQLLNFGKGRAIRMEFWVATLVLPLIYPIVESVPFDHWTKHAPSLVIVSLAALWLHFAIRRCHDRDRSGWWCLLAFVPVAGQIWAVMELGLRPGTKFHNRFGPDPLLENRMRELFAYTIKDMTSTKGYEQQQEAAFALHAKISELDTGVPDMNLLLEALRLFERETGKDLKMSIGASGQPPHTSVRRSEGSTSHDLVVEGGAYVDYFSDRSDHEIYRYMTLAEAVFEFAADWRMLLWVQKLRRENIPVK